MDGDWPDERDAAETPIALVNAILRAYRRHGCDPSAALHAADIPLALLEAPSACVSAHQIEVLTATAMHELDDEGLGLYQRRLRCGSFELLTRACVSAPDLGEALQRWCQLRPLLADDLRVHLAVQGDVARLHIEELRRLPERDIALLSLMRQVHGLASWLVDAPLPLAEAAFPAPGPAFRHAYHPMFPGPVRFEGKQAALRFASTCLSWPVRRDEADTRTMLKHPVLLMVHPFRRQRPLIQRARSLQRHLANEGSSFQQLKDAIRREQAIELLNRSQLPIKRIAAQLAFGDDKSFVRAFRRWTGSTPKAWRQRTQGSFSA